ncbi:MAG: fimbria major subunit [Muribaculaceae bacterium]|nr:fimbria major subunit [Muribaculaceae bacterium]
MTSKAAYPIRLSLDELHRQHYTPATALDLNSRNTGNKGPLEIHRMVARIDLDWQRMKFAIDAETGESTRIDRKGFGIYEYEDIENPANVKYSLTIDGVALANISRDYKLFNESGYFNDNPSKDEDGEWRIFGNFTESNNGNNFDYARDPKGVTKASSFGIDYFYQGMNDLAVDKNSGKSNKKHSDFYFTNLKDFATADTHWGGLDENEHWNDYFEGDLEVPGNETYVAWHYTLPNSIHLKNKQQKNNTTAVIYRAMIGDNALIEQAEREGKDVFAYGNDIYGNFDQFRSAALEEDSEGNLVNKGKNINVLFGTTWDRYVALVKASNYNDRVSALRTQIATLESQIREIEQMIPEIARLRAENAELDAVYEELSPEDQENNRKEKTNNENIINRNKNRYRELIGSEYIDQTLEDQEVVNFISETNAEISNLSRLADDLNDNSKFDEDGNLRLTFYDAELFRKAAKEAGLRTYQATNVGTKAQPDYHYYCYYYYWIRHRDNSNDMMMGPMEFAIVRNYVYKLSIGKIFDLGYPDDPGDDPDPEIPGDPVEDAKVKLKVNVKVLPWGVRYDDDITLY